MLYPTELRGLDGLRLDLEEGNRSSNPASLHSLGLRSFNQASLHNPKKALGSAAGEESPD